MGDPVLSQWCWDGVVRRPEFDRVGDDLALGVHLKKFEAKVGVERRPYVESFLGAEPQERRCSKNSPVAGSKTDRT